VLGDEGSGYAIALTGLRAAAKAADGRAPATRLLPMLLERLELGQPDGLILAFNRPALGGDPSRIATLAEVVIAAADEGDAVAGQILDQAAAELAGLVAAVVQKLALAPKSFPLALAGGVLVGSGALQDRLRLHLQSQAIEPAAMQPVADPVWGAVLHAESQRRTASSNR
jgi:N-acetylglucosamine kinase-like BadF-type ATPase